MNSAGQKGKSEVAEYAKRQDGIQYTSFCDETELADDAISHMFYANEPPVRFTKFPI